MTFSVSGDDNGILKVIERWFTMVHHISHELGGGVSAGKTDHDKVSHGK